MAHRTENQNRWSPGSTGFVFRGMLVLLVVGFLPLACSQTEQREDAASPQVADPIEYYAGDLAQAAKDLIDITPEAQRADLLLPFDSTARTRGRDTSQTPAFCSVLQWCPVGWGLTVCSLDMPQRTAVHTLLNRAMSPGGYQALVAILNRNRIIGEMEDVGDGAVVGEILESAPTAEAESIFDLMPDPSDPPYPVVGGAKDFPGTGTDIEWTWDPPPGLEARYEQFCNYTIAIFGTPDDDAWALRFEGHHIAVNVTIGKNDDGQFEVHSTPLFFGAFPMVVPEDPYDPDDTTTQWHWAKGQVLMLSVVHHLREFWRNVDEESRRAAFIGADLWEQAPPLLLDTPPSSLITALSPTADQEVITAYPHIEIQPDALSDKALWNLRQAFSFYTGAMNSTVGQSYLTRFDRAVQDGKTLTLAWAGGSLDDIGSHHFTYAVVGDLLLEVLQSNQFSVQHDPDLTGNHLHTMLRDLSFDWDDPMARHHHDDHTTSHPN